MQIHGPDTLVDEIEVASYHPGAVTLTFGHVRVVVYNAADCDELIKAAAAAKQLLLDEQQEDTFCTASTDLSDEETVYCDRDAGHAGSHHAPGPDEGSEVAWSDEPAQDDEPEWDSQDSNAYQDRAEAQDSAPVVIAGDFGPEQVQP